MDESFVPETGETRTPPVSSSVPTDSPPERTRIKVLIVSTPKGVNNTIRTLYTLGFAEVTEWSELQPTANPGEVMSVLSRYIRIN